MSETYTLTTPIVPVEPMTTSYYLVRFVVERAPVARLSVLIQSNAGDRIEVRYSDDAGGTTAATLISNLNTANLSTKSLQRRLFDRLAADGYLPAGAVTGTPD